MIEKMVALRKLGICYSSQFYTWDPLYCWNGCWMLVQKEENFKQNFRENQPCITDQSHYPSLLRAAT